MKNKLQNFKKKALDLLYVVKRILEKSLRFIEKQATNILTLILVVVTAYYARELNNITSHQMLLSAEPNIALESRNFESQIKINSGKFHFLLSNQGPGDYKLSEKFGW